MGGVLFFGGGLCSLRVVSEKKGEYVCCVRRCCFFLFRGGSGEREGGERDFIFACLFVLSVCVLFFVVAVVFKRFVILVLVVGKGGGKGEGRFEVLFCLLWQRWGEGSGKLVHEQSAGATRRGEGRRRRGNELGGERRKGVCVCVRVWRERERRYRGSKGSLKKRENGRRKNTPGVFNQERCTSNLKIKAV